MPGSLSQNRSSRNETSRNVGAFVSIRTKTDCFTVISESVATTTAV